MPNALSPIVSQGNFLRIENAVVDEAVFSSRNTGFLVVSYADRLPSGITTTRQLRLNVNSNTIILNSFRLPMCFCDIRVGMRIDATYSPRMTRSIPPQANAFMIVTRRQAQPQTNTTRARVLWVDAVNNRLYTGLPNNINRQTIYLITNSTVILNRNGIPIRLRDLRPGQLVQITHANFQTASIPPQTTAFRIQVL